MTRDPIIDLFLSMTPQEQDIILPTIPPELLDSILPTLTTETTHTRPTLLPHQTPPDTGWDGFVLAGGRGAGKSFAGGRLTAHMAETTPNLRGRIIAPTLADAVNSAILDPDSGILAHSPTARFRGSGIEGARVEWPNGSTVWAIGTPTLRDVDRLRALTNIDWDWYEEAAANPQLARVVEQAALSRRGTRLPKPVWIATTTPRPVPTYKAWLNDPTVAVNHATTMDNPHTPDAYHQYAEALKGTRLHRQEILGEVVDDVEGALWTLGDLERSTIPPQERDTLISRLGKVVVGVDPPSGSGTCGIIVTGRDDQGHLYILDDYSMTDATPHQWATAVNTAAHDYQATVVAEINQGGRMVTEVLRQVNPALPINTVRATVGKKTRAEPVAALWEPEEQIAHLAPASPDSLTRLVVELTEWVAGESESPDRLDAMVWACHHLLTGGKATVHSPTPITARRFPTSFRTAIR